MAAQPLPAAGGVVAPRRPAPAAPPRRRTATAPPRRRGAAPAGADAPRPALRLVPEARPRQRLASWVYGAVAGAILIAGVLGIVALNALAAEASFEARTLEREIAEATLRHDDLVAVVASLAAPSRVRDVATADLGLVEPQQPGFLTLDPAQLQPDVDKPPVRLGE